MTVTILRIPTWTRGLLARLPGWKQTPVAAGKRIVRHAHKFFAVYFVFGIGFLDTGNERRSLPPAAIVLVPPRVVHGWIGSDHNSVGTVGHFHQGHPVHVTERIGAEAA